MEVMAGAAFRAYEKKAPVKLADSPRMQTQIKSSSFAKLYKLPNVIVKLYKKLQLSLDNIQETH